VVEAIGGADKVLGTTLPAYAQAIETRGPSQAGSDGRYTYHVRSFRLPDGRVHQEIIRTYRGVQVPSKDDSKKSEWVPSGAGYTKPEEFGVVTDVFLWRHEAAVVALDIPTQMTRSRLLTIETGPTGLNERGEPGYNWYTARAATQDSKSSLTFWSLSRELLESTCDPDD
jgi:hypothetical protein